MINSKKIGFSLLIGILIISSLFLVYISEYLTPQIRYIDPLWKTSKPKLKINYDFSKVKGVLKLLPFKSSRWA